MMNWGKWPKQIVALGCVAVIWLVVLPRISRWGPVDQMIRSHQARGIDPSAMFYTELEPLRYRNGMLRRGGSSEIPGDLEE